MKRFVAALSLVTLCTVAHAHFPWMVVNEQGHVEYFFGEGMTDRTYKMPPGIAKADVLMREDGKLVPVATEAVESNDLVGKRSVASVPTSADLVSQATFGVYHGAKLQYYTQHLGGEMPTSFSECKPYEGMDLQTHTVDTDSGVDVYVLWQGQPLEGATVKLYCEDGHEEGEGMTDASGVVSFSDKQVEEGMNAIMVGHTVPEETGKVGDQEYQSAMHYLTATFVDPEDK